MKYNVYYTDNQYRQTGMSRLEAINHYNTIIQRLGVEGKTHHDIHIYCSTKDFYVTGSFLMYFLNPTPKVAEIHFDKGGLLLANTLRGLKYRVNDKICFVNKKKNTIEFISYESTN
jgi:hypothetical protein